jgi:hypothetical protein
MSLITRENQFEGVNPLLHNLFQEEGSNVSYLTFSSAFSYNMAKQLNNEAALEHDYFVVPNDQVLLHGLTLMNQEAAQVMREPALGTNGNYSWEPEISDDTADTHSVVISMLDPDAERENHKKPLTVIEVLSPEHLGSDLGRKNYGRSRQTILNAGINLVEIHLLHRYAPARSGIPPYPDDENSTAYHILVTCPQDTVKKADGKMVYHSQVYTWNVGEPLPVITLPLDAGQTIQLDLDELYQRTFYTQKLGVYVDYSLPASHFSLNSYSTDDQQIIQNVLASLQNRLKG